MTPGIYLDYSREEYDKILALNYSGMKSFIRCPADFLFDFNNKTKATDSMLNGRAFHWRVFESKKYLDRVKLLEGRLKTTKQVGDEIHTHIDTRAGFENMYAKIMESNVNKKILSSGTAETTILWNDPETGIPCKARLDWINSEHHIIVDLKTSKDASYKGFIKSAINFKYHWQAYWYKTGLEILSGEQYLYWIIAIEGAPYYHRARYRFPASTLLRAEEKIRDIKLQFRECLDKDSWPENEDVLEDLELPDWA